MKHSLVYTHGAVLLIGLLLAGSLDAQRVVADGRAEQEATATAVSPLSRPVTVKLDAVDVQAAIKTIAQQAGVRVQYQNALFHGVDSRVTLDTKAVSLQVALDRVLLGLPIRVVVLDDDLVGLKPAVSVADGIVIGKVIHSKTKQPLVSVTISIDGETSNNAVTGSDGTFRLRILPGKHRITIRHVGFVRQVKMIQVADGATVSLDVSLEPSASVLDEVIVTGTLIATERKAIPNPITVITAQEIEQRGITQIEQLFRGQVPGVLALDQGTLKYAGGAPGNDELGVMASSAIYTRGASGLGMRQTGEPGRVNPLKTYVDGVELLDPSYLGTIDPQSIERIEIITGPQAATIYGSGAMGGVMQIFTKRGSGQQAPDITVNLKAGILESNVSNGRTPTHNHSVTVAGGAGPEFTYSGILSYNYTGQWQPSLFSRGYGASFGINHVRSDVTIAGSVSTTSGENGTTPGGMTESPVFNKLRQEGEVWTTNPASAFSNRTSGFSSQMISFSLDYRPTPAWQHHVTLGRSNTAFRIEQHGVRYYQPGDSLFSAANSQGYRASASYNTTMLLQGQRLSSTVTVGGNASWGEQIRSNGCIVTNTATAYVVCGPNSWQVIAVARSSDSRSHGGFGRWQMGFFDRLFLTFGLRGEYNPAYGTDHKVDWTPSNGVAYTMEHGNLSIKFLGSYGKATRPPTPGMRKDSLVTYDFYDPSQFLGILGNPNLTPEYSRGPQGGFELYYSNLVALTINHYRQNVTDVIQRVIADSIEVFDSRFGIPRFTRQYQYLNIADIQQYGWEGTASINVGPLALKGVYSWSESRVKAVSSSAVGRNNLALVFYPGMSFILLPSHTGNVSASYARGGTGVTLSVNYIGATLQESTHRGIFAMNGYYRILTYADRARFVNAYWSKPGYVKSDATLSQRISERASLTLLVSNLGNSFDSDAGVRNPTLGRQTRLGLSLRFPSR